jgi:hypothetical protein
LALISALEGGAVAPPERNRVKFMTALGALDHHFGRDSVRLGGSAVSSNCAEL